MSRIPPTIRSASLRRRRRGASIVECAITLPVLCLVLFALLDLGIAATRYNALAEISRRIAREAVLHGSIAPEEIGGWGPDEYNGTLADGTEFVDPARGMNIAMNDDDVEVRITWPDADNSTRDRVLVEASYLHQPLVPAICPWGTLELKSSATMHIVN